MSIRTYLPGLLNVIRAACKYAKRWETFIRSHLPDEAAQTAFTNFLTACEILEDILKVLVPPGT